MLPEFNKIFFIGIALAFVLTLISSAPQPAGVTSMNQARILLFIAWITSIVTVCVSLNNPSAKHIVVAAITTAILVGLPLYKYERWITQKVQQREFPGLPIVSISQPWLRPYLKFFLLAWQEFKLSWRDGWGLGRFLTIGAGLAVGLLLTRAWLVVALSLLTIFLLCTIELLRRAYGRTVWLQDLAKTDRQNIGAGVRIAGCEVEIELFRELGRGWVEFRFKIFNGSVFPIALADIVGSVSFSNMIKPRKLDGEFKVLPSLSAENCQRHNVGHFTLHHELSKEDVAFISAAKEGCFMLGELIITVRGQGEAFDDLPATRLATGADDVQPTLRGAFRHDASALEAIWKSHISRMNALNVVQGMYEKAYSQLQRTEATIPGWAAKDWELDTLMVLDRGYKHRTLSEHIYKRIWLGHAVPETADEQERCLGNCIQRLLKIIAEEAENIKP